MWRYAEVMPEANPVTLGEGFTPMLPSREFPNAFMKEEGDAPKVDSILSKPPPLSGDLARRLAKRSIP